jgi:type IV pilus assembly protein PilY1
MVTLDDGALVPFCIGCSPDSPLESVQPTMPTGSVPPQPKSRMYWYIQR